MSRASLYVLAQQPGQPAPHHPEQQPARRQGRHCRSRPEVARETIDVTGKLVIPGMIDTHGHVYEGVTGKFGLAPDMVGIQSAVTTVIDQSGPSCMTFGGFRKIIVEPSHTRVLAFISAHLVGGIKPNALGAEMHGYNVRVPNTNDGAARNANPFFGVAPFSLTHAMTELLTLGLFLPDIVATVTSNPAAMIRMQDSLGTLQPGRLIVSGRIRPFNPTPAP